jgi:class 3 adenylate cyclase
VPLVAPELPARRRARATTEARPDRVTGRVAHQFGRLLRTKGLGPRATAVAVAVTSRIVVANAVAGLLVITYLTISEDIDHDAGETWAATVVGNVLVYVAGVVLLSIAAMVRGRKVFAPSWAFLDDDRAVTDADRRQLLRQPARMGFFPLRYWTVAAGATIAGRLIVGESARQVVVSGVTVVIGGLVAAATGFLLGERALRPTFAIALAGQAPPDQPSLGLGTRLVLAWVLGAGLPLALIGATPFLVSNADLGSDWAILTLSVIALVAGFSLMVIAARSISRPLARVREALRLVGEGDLTVDVVVDDGGELGRLQAGVNEMVAGLRERERIEDLFGRHVGAAVARRAVAEGAELGGEVRSVSALFVDLRGSTELARRRPPEDVVALLNRFFAAVVAACDAEEGWLDKFEGDGALCVFGAPGEQPDHADRALRAARRLAEAIGRLRAVEPDLDAGIGVATGRAVAGHVGTVTRLEYTVIGDPVNTAARLTVAAKDLDPRVLAAGSSIEAASAEEARRWAPAAAVDLKGLAPGLATWAPTGER